MIITRTMNDDYLSNTWLVGDREGGHAVLIDSGGPTGPILEAIEQNRLTLTHVLCTHHHIDHVQFNDEYTSRFGCRVCGHRAETELFGGLDVALDDGDELVTGGLHVRALHVPGHTVGQLSFLLNEKRVFTGDTLFKGSIGGTMAPGHTTFEDIRNSLMDVLMRLPKEMPVHPGHMEETTIGHEWETNAFIRAFRGADTVTERRCTAFGRPATLLLDAPDYDGGRKCWVRFDEGNRLDIVPGSQVQVR